MICLSRFCRCKNSVEPQQGIEQPTQTAGNSSVGESSSATDAVSSDSPSTTPATEGVPSTSEPQPSTSAPSGSNPPKEGDQPSKKPKKRDSKVAPAPAASSAGPSSSIVPTSNAIGGGIFPPYSSLMSPRRINPIYAKYGKDVPYIQSLYWDWPHRVNEKCVKCDIHAVYPCSYCAIHGTVCRLDILDCGHPIHSHCCLTPVHFRTFCFKCKKEGSVLYEFDGHHDFDF